MRTVLCLLITGILALAIVSPTVSAQIGGGSVPPQEESILPTATNAKEVVTDPEGDTSIFGGPDPTPENDYKDSADIVSLTVAETEHELRFDLKHRAYGDLPAQTSELVFAQNMWCSVGFYINSDNETRFEIDMYGEGVFDGGPYRFNGYVGYWVENEDYGYMDYEIIESVYTALVDYDHVEVVFPKQYLSDAADRGPFRIGDRLTDFDVECYRMAVFPVQYQDEAGTLDTGATDYEILTAPSSDEIALRFPEGNDGSLEVSVGRPAKFPVELKNWLQRKLLVNVTAQLVDTDGNVLPDWKVQAVPTVELRANESLPISVIVQPPPDAEHRDSGLLRIKAFPLGFADRVALTGQVQAVVTPTPEANTLYFHNAPWAQDCWNFCLPAPAPGLSYPPDTFLMNTLESDPEFGEEATEDEGLPLFSSDDTWVVMDTALAQPLRFRPDEDVQLQVALRTDVARDAELDVKLLLDGGEELVAATDAVLSLGDSFQTFTLPMAVRPDMQEIPKGQRLQLLVQMADGNVGPLGIRFGGTALAPVEWDPGQSLLALPLAAVPVEEVNITDGRSLPSIALGNSTDADEYVNPGDTQSFDLVLLNEGTLDDILTLEAEQGLPGWDVKYFPGRTFKLDAGAGAPLCVSITAPDDALEGEILHLNLTARSEAEPGVTTRTMLRLIVTTAEVDEDTCTEIPGENMVKPLTDKEKSPAPTAIGLALSALGVAFVLRRRSA